MAIDYRQARPQDLQALLPLVEAYAMEQQEQMPINTVTANFMEFVRAGIAQAIDSPAAVVMLAENVSEQSKEIVGYAVGMAQEPPPAFEPEIYNFISDLYVTPAFRRQGIATGLVERVRGWGWVKGIYRLSLVLPVGSPAQGLYAKLGFKTIQTMLYYKENA